MKLVTMLLMSLALAAGTAAAQDKKDAMAKPMTMSAKECTDYMDMAKKDAMKKDAKKDATCAEMMKNHMMKSDAMKGDAMKKDAMKK